MSWRPSSVDVVERRPWLLDDVVAELERGYGLAAPVLTAAGGALDGVALGEWIHGGDIREALDEPRPYESDGPEEALVLLVERSQGARWALPVTHVRLPDRDLQLGVAGDRGLPAELITDAATLIRLYAGCCPDPARFRLTGAEPAQFALFA